MARWDLHRLQPGRQRRIRYDQWAAQRPWSNGAVGSFGLPIPARSSSPRWNTTFAQGDGTGDDLRYTRDLLVLGRRVGWVVARLDRFNSRRTCDVASGFLGTDLRAGRSMGHRRDRLRNYRPRPLCPTSKVLPRGTTNGCAIRRGTRGGSGQPSKASTPPSAPRCSTSPGGSTNRTGLQGGNQLSGLVTSRDTGDSRTKLILGAWTHGVAAVQRKAETAFRLGCGDRLR